jgi:hypothetical protein
MGTGVIPRFWSAPPGVYGGGQEQDPVAALIGKGLQAFGAVRTARQQEADRQERLQQQQEQTQSETSWRNYQMAAPQREIDTENRKQAGFVAGGHGIAKVMGIETDQSPIDDPTAAILGQHPEVAMNYKKLQEPPDRNIDPNSPAGIAAAIAKARGEAEFKPPSDVQAKGAASAGDMVGGARLMRDILTRNPSAAAGAYNKLLLMAKYPVAGSLGLDAARRLGIISEPTDDERNFMTGAEQYMNGKLGLTSGSRITENQYRLHLAPVIPSASETPGSLAAKANLINQSVRARVMQTQKAFRDQYGVLEPESQAYLQSMGYDPVKGGFGATPSAPVAPPSAVIPPLQAGRGVPNFRKFERRP